MISVYCEQPLDELTVHIWLLYANPNLNIALYIGGTELCTEMDKQTDHPITNVPSGPFGLGYKNFSRLIRVISHK